MAARAFWKGYLKLSLVTCRVQMTPAVSESERLRFHNINGKTGNRVANTYVDTQTGKIVRPEDQLRGYEVEEGRNILFEDEELDAVALESTRTIDIETFVPMQSVGWIWYDSPHYLAPADKVGAEAFAVIREAMRATDTAGLSRLVLYRREHPVLIVPRDKGMMVWTLRQNEEVRSPNELPGEAETPAAKSFSAMKKVIAAKTRKWSPDLAEDPVEARLHEIIDARMKKTGRRKTKAPAKAERPDNVIDIMDALKKSLAKEKGR